MSKLFQNTAFNIGFWLTIAIFALLNMRSYEVSYAEYINRKLKFSAGGYNAGFPFTFYQAMIGYPNVFQYYWIGLFLDISVAIISSFIVGSIFKLIWSKHTARKLK